MADEVERDARLSEAVMETAARYEAVPAALINHWLIDLLPQAPGSILDVGAGTGRDAAWLAALGHDVVALEPNRAMREEAERWHPDKAFTLLDDRLPDLSATSRTGLSFDFILANAMWMFIAPGDRELAFRKLTKLLKPHGVIAITLRRPIETRFGMHPVSIDEIERLSQHHGTCVERIESTGDFWHRDQINWTQIAVRRVSRLPARAR